MKSAKFSQGPFTGAWHVSIFIIESFWSVGDRKPNFDCSCRSFQNLPMTTIFQYRLGCPLVFLPGLYVSWSKLQYAARGTKKCSQATYCSFCSFLQFRIDWITNSASSWKSIATMLKLAWFISTIVTLKFLLLHQLLLLRACQQSYCIF